MGDGEEKDESTTTSSRKRSADEITPDDATNNKAPTTKEEEDTGATTTASPPVVLANPKDTSTDAAPDAATTPTEETTQPVTTTAATTSTTKPNPYDALRYTIVRNDGKPESMIKLVGLKSLFAKQLPKMPRAYIARLVFDRRHTSLAILSDNPELKDSDEEIIGGICYRAFPEMRFAGTTE